MKDYLKLMFKWHFLDWEKIWYYKHSLEISITKNLTTWKIAIKPSNFKMSSLKSQNMHLESRLDDLLDIILMRFVCSSYLISFTFSQDRVWNACFSKKNDWPILPPSAKTFTKAKILSQFISHPRNYFFMILTLCYIPSFPAKLLFRLIGTRSKLFRRSLEPTPSPRFSLAISFNLETTSMIKRRHQHKFLLADQK